MPPRRLALAWALSGALAAGVPFARAAVPTPGQAPAVEPGSHAAQWCVSVSAQAPSCGPVTLQVVSPSHWTVRVDDILYRLQLRGPVLDAFVFHGTVQIDEFTATARWLGHSLEFLDEAKATRFTLQLPGAPR